jgi:hypothetical protein
MSDHLNRNEGGRRKASLPDIRVAAHRPSQQMPKTDGLRSTGRLLRRERRGAGTHKEGQVPMARLLAQPERWRRMLAHMFEEYLDGRPLGRPLPALASG